MFFEDIFDQRLGLRAWDERTFIDQEIHRPEFTLPGEVGYRVSLPTPLDELQEVSTLRLIQLFFRPGEQVGAVAPQHVAEQDLSIEVCRR